MKKISIILPVYNDAEELGKTLESIARQEFPLDEIEILVVDDGSQVDMKPVLLPYLDRVDIRYYWHRDEGFHLAAVRNAGIHMAKGEVCLFIYCGVIVTSGCLGEHYRLYQENGEKLCVIGYILGNDTTSDLEEMRQIIDTHSPDEAAALMVERNMIDGRERTYQGMGDDLSTWPAPYTVLWGLHFSVPRAFLRENNIFFDEYFTTWGCEDNDFGIQLAHQGAKFVLARRAVAIHYPPQVRSYDRLHSDPKFRAGWQKNRDYVKEKYPDDPLVQLWLAKGGWAANHPGEEGVLL